MTGSRYQPVVIRPEEETLSKQQLPYFVGVSSASGATNLSMNIVIIPPNSAADPHLHRGFESAIYMMKGDAEVFYGPALQDSLMVEEGDFLFIPADVIHQPVNHGDEPIIAIVARNTSDEQESVELYSELDIKEGIECSVGCDGQGHQGCEQSQETQDPFVTAIIESLSRPICKECYIRPPDRLPSPLWKCPHR